MYLEKFYDQGNTIGSTDIKKQIEINAWLFFQVSGLGPAQGQVNWFTHYHDSKNEDALKRYLNETNRCYGVLDQQIGLQKYICGDKFTLADAAFYVLTPPTPLKSARIGLIMIAMGRRHRLCQSHPAIQRPAMVRRGLQVGLCQKGLPSVNHCRDVQSLGKSL